MSFEQILLVLLRHSCHYLTVKVGGLGLRICKILRVFNIVPAPLRRLLSRNTRHLNDNLVFSVLDPIHGPIGYGLGFRWNIEYFKLADTKLFRKLSSNSP